MVAVKDVFVAGGMPRITYVDRASLNLEKDLRREIDEGYKVICVTGPTKSGKTVLTRHILGPGASATVNGGQVKTSEEFWTLLLQELKLPDETTIQSSSEASAGVRWLLSAQAKASEGDSLKFSNKNKTTILDYMRESGLALIVDDFHYMQMKFRRKLLGH